MKVKTKNIMKEFQVKIGHIKEIRDAVINLALKAKWIPRDNGVGCEICPYVQFGGGTCTHSETPFKPSRWPIITIDDCLALLNPEPKNKTIKLNKEYTAQVIEGQGVVKVGCQNIPTKAIRELVKTMDELNCP